MLNAPINRVRIVLREFYFIFSLSLSLFSFDQTHASISLESAGEEEGRGGKQGGIRVGIDRIAAYVIKGASHSTVRGMGRQITLVYRSGVFTRGELRDDTSNESKVSRDFSRFLSR